MKLVETSVKRPVGVIMIVFAIIVLGIVSLRGLIIDLLPEIDLPIAVVATSYPDAGPEDVENIISRPIESAVSSIEGIEMIQSQSQSGSSLVLLMFKNGIDLDQALLDVREKMDQVKGSLPDRAGDPAIIRFSPDQLPVMWVGLTGDDPEVLTEIANSEVVPYFERQEGVASVTVEGGKDREIQVMLDRKKLLQYGISSQHVMQAISSTNSSSSVGKVDKGSKDLQLRVVGDYESVDDIKQTIIQTEAGATIHVEDVAEVKDTFSKAEQLTLVNGKPSLVLSVMKKTDGNTVDVAHAVQDGMVDLEETLPEGVHLDIVIDTSEIIEMSVDSVVQNIIIGGAISIIVLLLFLKSIRATLVIGISIPIAIISTFILMYFTGESLNVLTLGGLALGIGMMVDSSIVILENIYSYRQRGYSLFESATKGASELTPAVIASTTTSLVVFLPIVFVDGIASDLFTPLALTVSFSLIASLIVAITLVPMLSSKLLSKAMETDKKDYWFDRFLEKVQNGYKAVLRWVLGHRKTTVFGTALAIVASLALTPFIGAELIPSSDQGQIQISVETDPGSSFNHTKKVVEQVSDKLQAYDKQIETDFLSLGGDDFGGGGGNTSEASVIIQLVKPKDRDKGDKEIIKDMSETLEDIPGANIEVSAMDSGMSFGDPISVELSGPEHEVLRELADEVVAEIEGIDGVYNPKSSAGKGVPQMTIAVDADKAALYGLNEEQVSDQIALLFTGQIVSQYREAGTEMNITMFFPEEERTTMNDLQSMDIQTATGASIPLDEVASLKEMQGPVTLSRQNQEAQLNVSSEVMDRDLSSVASDVEAKLEQMSEGFPEGYRYNIGGEVEDMLDSFFDLALALVFSIFLVYAVMAIQFENFLFPFIIMFSMPATIIGVLGGLFITGLPLSVPALIGVIMLAGIVVNNSIVLVDYINILRKRGMDRYDAIIEAGRSRLRPILMTTLTTVLAMIPLGLALGEGAELQQPLAVTIIFGLSVSSLFTLLLIPVVYTLFDDLTGKFSKKNKKKQAEIE